MLNRTFPEFVDFFHSFMVHTNMFANPKYKHLQKISTKSVFVILSLIRIISIRFKGKSDAAWKQSRFTPYCKIICKCDRVLHSQIRICDTFAVRPPECNSRLRISRKRSSIQDLHFEDANWLMVYFTRSFVRIIKH